MSHIEAGVCLYCHCTAENPCRVAPWGSDDTCCLLSDTNFTVCSARDCLIKWEREQKAAKAERARKPRKHGDKYVGWGFGAVIADKKKEERRRARKGAR